MNESVSDNDVSVIENEVVETVSGADPVVDVSSSDVSGADVSGSDVSGSDLYSTVSGNTGTLVPADYTEIIDAIDGVNSTLIALLFFTIFTWVEIRIRTAVKEVINNGKLS